MPHQAFPKPTDSLAKKIWYVFFILLYPVLVTFSLLFTSILLLFSGLSKLLFKLIQLFSAKPTSVKNEEKVDPTLPSTSAHS
ncbi:hypothetical protein GXP67_17335 [Rhodocytophaga rosea]|uniref:Uncharacterized protein n=1 Tax=Rhodocytophaga rosea TaxID=2704465 RepID=A0A6C0GJR7_9BACT|nr:hypothetical protein [Rhodocytophaga rosea]QHT68278.1 hypothetical protein GXP67_17335 [Rhodocytophaga rosea]